MSTAWTGDGTTQAGPELRSPFNHELWGESADSWEADAWAAPEIGHEVTSAGVRAGRLEVARVPLLARHRGNAPALVLRWNDMPALPQEVDVVVHLHGYSRPGMRLPRHIEPYSGLDLAPVDAAAGRGRSRPTLTVLPRGDFTGVKQKHGNLYRYTFPALVAKDALPKLVRFSLQQFAAEVGGRAPRVARLILTAHSGGGQPLMEILKHHDPHEVHVFDALYWRPGPLVEWARCHIRQDRGGTPSGALRVFYGRGTRRFSRQLLEAISAELGPALADRYRIEKSTLGHWQIPRQYGWRILADPAADVPNAEREPLVRREAFEVDLEDDDFEAAPFHEWEESEDSEEAEDPELVAATAAYEALPSAFEVSDLDRASSFSEAEEAEDEHEALSAAHQAVDLQEENPLWEAEEAEGDFELGIETSQYEALSAAHEAADLAAEDALWEVWEAEDEEGVESGEVELGESEAFLEDLYSLEPVFEEETGETVTFPSGATLRVVSGPTGDGEEHYDPNATGNPLLDTSESIRSTRLSTSFTVGELAFSGGRHFDKARIDPQLVRCLQKLRHHVGKAVRVTSGYRPYLYNVDLYKKRDKKPTKSRHSSGQGADVKIAGMTGLEIAKAAIDACGTEIGVGIGGNYAHIDVRGKWAYWTYPREKPPNERWVAEINAHRRQRLAAGPTAAPAAAPAHDGAPSAGVATQMLDALGRGLWDTAVRIAIGAGITDVNRLTNMLFYLRHPELRGKRIEPHQRELAREWTEIRDRWVKPGLHGAPPSPPSSPVPPRQPRTTRWLANAWARYRCAKHLMVPVYLMSNRTPVNPETVEAFERLAATLESTGYHPSSTWVYVCRQIRRGTGAWSLHAYGLAVDIDPRCNPHRRTRAPLRFPRSGTQSERCEEVRRGTADTAFTAEQIAAVEAIRTVDGLQVFAWGGRWRNSKDTMHFQIDVSPDELRRGLAATSVAAGEWALETSADAAAGEDVEDSESGVSQC